MMLGAHVVLCMTARFFEKMGQKWTKNRVFEFIGKCSHYFFQNLFYNESLYYLLYSCTNLIFGKNLVREIWARMLSVNQSAGFLYQLYL